MDHLGVMTVSVGSTSSHTFSHIQVVHGWTTCTPITENNLPGKWYRIAMHAFFI